jgi:hypothetical protein
MSNPPAGWYPDPTGQPNTIRWWNGTKWTNKTEKETGADGTANQPADPDSDEKAIASSTGDTGTATAEEVEAAAAKTVAAPDTRPAWTQPESTVSKSTVSSSHWTQQPLPEPAQPEPAQPEPLQPEPAQPEPAQPESAQSEPVQPWSQSGVDQSQAAGTSNWQTSDAAPTEQQNPSAPWQQNPDTSWQQNPDTSWQQEPRTAWQQSGEPGPQAQAQGWPQSPTPNLSQESGQQQTQESNQGWAQQPDEGWAQQPDQGWAQQPDQGWPQGGAGQNAPVLTENQWQTSDTGQQQFPPPLAPTSGSKSADRDRQQGSGSRSKAPLLIGGAVALVLIVVAGVFFALNRGDDKADAGPPPATQSTDPATSTTPSNTPKSSAPTPTTTPSGGQNTVPPGQSKNPKLHGGARIASDAISFPRQKPPWSDRKRFVPQLLDSSGQYVLLQENFDGKNDWYADVFVGGLGTSVLFNGDPKATASDLTQQLPSNMYGGIPITVKPLRNGAVKRSGKSGWYYQQSITANSPKVTARTLTLTVAVFDLGDGTAAAYVSDIPTNRADLKAAESQAYKGINVG